MTQFTFTDTLASYVPQRIQKRILMDASPIDSPIKETFRAVVLFTDISGFTMLTERLAKRGASGTESLAHFINSYFDQLIVLIHRSGGDIIKFAGDGLIAVWPVEAGPREEAEQALGTAALAVADCGLKIRERLDNFRIEDITLRLKLAISAGEVTEMHVGGVFDHWEFLVVGDPLVELGAANRMAKSGDVLVTPSALETIKKDCSGTPVDFENGGARGKGLRLEKLNAKPPSRMALERLEIAEGTEKAFHAYIPDIIFTRLSAGHSDWLAELRKVSLLFVNLPALNQDTALEVTQSMMQRIQGIVHRFEGSINKINVDDKGITVDVAFGLPPYTHENDPVRCIRAALALRNELRSLEIKSSIGVTTGRVFCGSIGSDARRQYTFLGDAVNLTARLTALGLRQAGLLQHENIPILCDRPTYDATKAAFEFETFPSQRVKGKSEPVEIFHPLREKRVSLRPQAELIGRRAERAELARALQALQQGAPVQVLVVRGEVGIGKSRLIEDLIARAQNSEVRLLVGKGDGIEKNNPYFGWRPVFNRIFGIEELLNKPQFDEEDRLAIRAAVLSKLYDVDPELVRYAPLLNVVLPTSLPDNFFTSALTGEIRGGNIRELLLRLLQQAAGQTPLLIVMEDLHWLDSASWTLLLDVYQKIRPILLILNTRPLPRPVPQEFDELLGKAETMIVELDLMQPDDVEMIVCQRLGVRSIPKEIGSLIRQKSEGHPFFAEELAYTLRDSGVLVIEGQDCRIAPERNNLERLELPDNLQAAITSRIDSLNPVPQLTLKVASVIGRAFTFQTLEAIHPIATDRPALPHYMDVLTNLNLTVVENEAPDLAYIFKHALTQEVAYNLMLFAQRGQLHEAVAEWIESNHTDDLPAYYTLLAHHWAQAAHSLEKATHDRVLQKAVDFLEKAGDQSLNNFANSEAAQFFSEALALTAEHNVEKLRLGQWYRKLADAYLGMGKLAEAKEYILKALFTLELPIPGSDFGRVVGVLAQVARQAGHRIRPGWFLGKALSAEQEASRLEIVQLCQNLAVVQFLNGDPNPLPMLFAVVAGLNVAETMKETPELWYMYSQMSAVCGFIPLPAQAQFYKDAWNALTKRVYQPRYFVSGAISLATVESGNGQWKDVKDKIEKAVAICEELGDYRQAGESIAYLTGNTLLESGPAMADVANQRMWELAVRRGNPIHAVWGYQVDCPALVWQGRLDECITAAQNSISVAESAYVGEIPDAIVRSAMWLAMWLKGQHGEAYAEVKKALDKFAKASVVDYSAYLIHAQLAEVALLALAQPRLDALPAGQVGETRKYAKQAIKNLKKYSAIFAIGEPALNRFSAELEWQARRPEKAYIFWRRAAAKAQALPMCYELGRAELALGQHLPVDDPERAAHLEKARQTFQHGGLENWAAVAKDALEAD